MSKVWLKLKIWSRYFMKIWISVCLTYSRLKNSYFKMKISIKEHMKFSLPRKWFQKSDNAVGSGLIWLISSNCFQQHSTTFNKVIQMLVRSSFFNFFRKVELRYCWSVYAVIPSHWCMFRPWNSRFNPLITGYKKRLFLQKPSMLWVLEELLRRDQSI